MNTAGGNEPRCHGDDHWWPVKKGETAPRYGDWCECGQAQFFPSHARDPSVRDVLAQLDRIETKVGALNEQVGALNARMEELTLKVKRVTS